MDDLEMTNLCADAMGLQVYVDVYGDLCLGTEDHDGDNYHYWPLKDDAQAMALVKKFRIGIDYAGKHGDCCGESLLIGPILYTAVADNLNRAIVECVAKMQNAKQAK